MKNEHFLELTDHEAMEINGGIAPVVVFAWACLGYAFSPVIAYGMDELASEFKRGYNDAKNSR